jgi:hypothetical protein
LVLASSSSSLSGSPDRVSPLSRPGNGPGIRPVIHHGSAGGLIARDGFLSPFGHRHSLLGHPIPAGELGPPHGRLTGQTPDPDGLPRSARASCDRGGRPLYPEDGGAHSGRSWLPAGACRFTAASPCTRRTSHRAGISHNEASTRVQAIHPSGLPKPVAARMERAALGLTPRASYPADQRPTTHAKVGTGQRARTWNYRSTHIRRSPIRYFTQCVRPRVARPACDRPVVGTSLDVWTYLPPRESVAVPLPGYEDPSQMPMAQRAPGEV